MQDKCLSGKGTLGELQIWLLRAIYCYLERQFVNREEQPLQCLWNSKLAASHTCLEVLKAVVMNSLSFGVYNSVFRVEIQLTFRRNISTPSSGSNTSSWLATFFHARITFGLLNPEEVMVFSSETSVDFQLAAD